MPLHRLAVAAAVATLVAGPGTPTARADDEAPRPGAAGSGSGSGSGDTTTRRPPRRGPVPRVVIVVEVAVNVSATRADALAAALADALNRELEVDALGGADVTRRLPAEGLPDECLGDPTCIATIASRLEANQLLFLAIVQVGDQTQIDATWVDAATGASASRPRAEIASEARAVSVFAELALRYLPDAQVRDKTIVVEGNGGGGAVAPPGHGRHFTRTTWITAGVGGATAAGALLLGLSTRARYRRCERAACTDDELDAVDRRALLADVTLGVSLAAVATTVVLYALSGANADDEPAVTPEIVATPGGAVLGLGGRF